MSQPEEHRLTIDLLRNAYRVGIFPMALHREGSIGWYEPQWRGILEFDDLRVSRSLRQSIRNRGYRITINRSFDQVVSACAGIREETWISKEIERLMLEMHREGDAHSVEAWLDGELVGGLYGVTVGRVFCGESMFHTRRDASKVCLVHLVDRLRECGFDFIDTQYSNPFLETLGVKEIPQEEYQIRLFQSLDAPAEFRGPIEKRDQ